MSRIRIADIARACDVSASTVMRCVHQNGYVSEENRKKIEETIQKSGYLPNRAAQGLRRKDANMIGCVVPLSFPNTFFLRVENAIEDAVTRHNFRFLSLTCNGQEANEKAITREFLSNMVSGIVFVSPCSRKHVEEVLKFDVPVVVIERDYGNLNVNRILFDDATSTELAINHFVKNNHKNIGFIGVNSEHKVEKDRIDGYKKCVQKNGLSLSLTNVHLVNDFTLENGYAATKAIFENGKPPTALFIASDLLACGALQYFYEKRIRIPDDVSVIGYDNSYSAFTSPALTTVAVPFDEVGDRIARIFNRPKDEPAENYTIQPMLIERQSVKKL